VDPIPLAAQPLEVADPRNSPPQSPSPAPAGRGRRIWNKWRI